jgi:hypothetical protein
MLQVIFSHTDIEDYLPSLFLSQLAMTVLTKEQLAQVRSPFSEKSKWFSDSLSSLTEMGKIFVFLQLQCNTHFFSAVALSYTTFFQSPKQKN